MLPAAELPAVARVNPVVVLIVITAFAMDPLARGHIEIPSSRAARASGIEVEGCAIARQRGTSVVGRRVNRGAQVRWFRPGVKRCRPCGDPQIIVAKGARATRRNEHFQSVPPDSEACVTVRAAELWDYHRGTERAVFTLCADVNVEVAGAVSPENTVEVNACDVCLVVLKEGRSVSVYAGEVDVRNEGHGRLPAEVVIRILAK